MKFYTALLAATCILTVPVFASPYEHSKVEIVSMTEGVGDLTTLDAALKISLPDGWYTYWRMPGDAGLSPVFEWRNQENIEDVSVFYPAPKRFVTADMHSFGYGYGGDIYLPLEIKPLQSGKELAADLKLNMMICKDICIPENHEISFTVPTGDPKPTLHAALIEQAKKSVPSKTDLPRLQLDTAVLGKDSIVVTAKARDGFDDAEVIVEVTDNIMNAPAEIIQGSDETRAVFKISAPDYIDNLTHELFGQDITVTLINKGRAVEKTFQF